MRDLKERFQFSRAVEGNPRMAVSREHLVQIGVRGLKFPRSFRTKRLSNISCDGEFERN